MICRTGKTGYRDADQARAALITIQTSHAAWNLDKIPVRFYRCPLCRAYHLTSMTTADLREASR